jgi:hypothetical protein
MSTISEAIRRREIMVRQSFVREKTDESAMDTLTTGSDAGTMAASPVPTFPENRRVKSAAGAYDTDF